MSEEQYNSPENRKLELHFVVHASGEILLVWALNLGGSLQAVDVVDQLAPQIWCLSNSYGSWKSPCTGIL